MPASPSEHFENKKGFQEATANAKISKGASEPHHSGHPETVNELANYFEWITTQS